MVRMAVPLPPPRLTLKVSLASVTASWVVAMAKLSRAEPGPRSPPLLLVTVRVTTPSAAVLMALRLMPAA